MMKPDGQFQKSSFSTEYGGTCVEIALDENSVRVRDTKDREGGTLAFTHSEWNAFISGAKAGEFDLPK